MRLGVIFLNGRRIFAKLLTFISRQPTFILKMMKPMFVRHAHLGFRATHLVATYIRNYFLPGYLVCALDNLFLCGTPLSTTLPMLERIRLAAPKMKFLWEHSAASQHRDQKILLYERLEEDFRAGLAAGKFSLDDKLMPQSSKN